MDTITVTKRCGRGHLKTQGISGRWHCTPCTREKRAKDAGLDPDAYKPLAKLAPDAPRTCARGHAKARRPAGHWVCDVCMKANSARRNADARERAGKSREPIRTPAAQLAEKQCPRGHQMVRRHGGTLVCNECRKIRRKGVEALRRAGTCVHTTEPGFEALITQDSTIACLQCVVSQANEKTSSGAA